MKHYLVLTFSNNVRPFVTLLMLWFGFTQFSYAQNGDIQEQADTSNTNTETNDEKLAVRIGFEISRINQDFQLMARVRSKVGARFQNTPGVEVRFYREEIQPDNFLGNAVSDHKGETKWIIAAEDSQTLPITYYAVVSDLPNYEDAEESADAYPSKLDFMLEEEDSVRIIKLFVGFPDDAGQIVPLAEAECNFYVNRLFGLLPFAQGETTDEEGYVTLEFPVDLKGDTLGNLEVVARIVENETIGTVQVSKSIDWGVPIITNDFYRQRELWSARANSPIILIVVVNILLLGIWGAIAFIFFEIYRINRLGKTN